MRLTVPCNTSEKCFGLAREFVDARKTINFIEWSASPLSLPLNGPCGKRAIVFPWEGVWNKLGEAAEELRAQGRRLSLEEMAQRERKDMCQRAKTIVEGLPTEKLQEFLLSFG